MTEQVGLFGGSVLSLQSKTHNTWSSRLTFSGDRVGIGTNSPGSLLHVNGKVTRNMKFVETIANLPADDGEWPLANVYIQAKVID